METNHAEHVVLLASIEERVRNGCGRTLATFLLSELLSLERDA